jgi:N-methylhydantoinase A
VFGELEAEACEWLGHEDIAPDDGRIERMAGMRYVDQGFELTVPWPPGAVTPEAVREATENFTSPP